MAKNRKIEVGMTLKVVSATVILLGSLMMSACTPIVVTPTGVATMESAAPSAPNSPLAVTPTPDAPILAPPKDDEFVPPPDSSID